MHLSTVKIPIDFGLINFQLQFNRKSYISYLHALTFVTQKITWRRAYVAQLSPLLWKNWCHSRLKNSHVIILYITYVKSPMKIMGMFFHSPFQLVCSCSSMIGSGEWLRFDHQGHWNMLAGKIIEIINCKYHAPHYRRSMYVFHL